MNQCPLTPRPNERMSKRDDPVAEVKTQLAKLMAKREKAAAPTPKPSPPVPEPSAKEPCSTCAARRATKAAAMRRYRAKRKD
jgi:hypothetical protein